MESDNEKLKGAIKFLILTLLSYENNYAESRALIDGEWYAVRIQIKKLPPEGGYDEKNIWAG